MNEDDELPFDDEDPALGVNRGIGSDIPYLRADSGQILKGSARNVELLFALDPDIRDCLRVNALGMGISIKLPVPWDPTGTGERPLTDHDYFQAQAWAETKHVFAAGGTFRAAMNAQAAVNAYHPVQDYLCALKWDGRPRVGNFLHDYFSCAPPAPASTDEEDIREFSDLDSYTRSVSRRWLISAVARAMEPGTKVDTMLILEGQQGIGKSQGLQALAGEAFFSDAQIDFHSKDGIMQMHDAWIIEIAEMDSLQRYDAAVIKAWLTRGVDKFRAPYGVSIQAVPRPSIMVGSTNAENYLKDESGGRRFWPVRCHGPVDVEGISEVRDQIWAEAYHLHRQGERWWLIAGEEGRGLEQQANRQVADAWESKVLALAEMKSKACGWTTVVEILTHGYVADGKPDESNLGMHISSIHAGHMNRAAAVLRSHGWMSLPRRRVDGERVRPWKNPEYEGPIVWDRPVAY